MGRLGLVVLPVQVLLMMLRGLPAVGTAQSDSEVRPSAASQ
jgi:hypothetical protein